MSAMALFCLVLMMTTRIMMNREAPREMEDKLRWKLKLLRVELMRLSCISEWLSASILLSTLRLGRWKPSELGSIEPKAMIPNYVNSLWCQNLLFLRFLLLNKLDRTALKFFTLSRGPAYRLPMPLFYFQFKLLRQAF